MQQFRASIGLASAGVLACALLAGCSDETNPQKPSSGGGKKHSEANASELPGKTLPNDSAKSETKTDVKPAGKTGAKPLEGRVEVKAVPDDPTPPVEATLPAKPEAKKDASPSGTNATEEPAAPKISSFASADDLTAELNLLVADVQKAAASEETYKEQVEGRFSRDGNTIALLAIGLALHDEDSPVKPHAKAIAAAAKKLDQAKDFAATSEAVAALKKAVDGKGPAGDELKWGKVSPLSSLMNDQVPNIDKRLKDGLRHFKSRTKAISANAATMALIAENARLYLGDTKKPTEAKQWNDFAGQLRSASKELAAKAKSGDEGGAKSAMEKLERSCHNCHAVFNPEK
jgi:cytochrome c556